MSGKSSPHFPVSLSFFPRWDSRVRWRTSILAPSPAAKEGSARARTVGANLRGGGRRVAPRLSSPHINRLIFEIPLRSGL